MDELQIEAEKGKIDTMSQAEMASLWRYAPAGHLYFVSGSPLWHHFNKRSEMASLWRYAPAGHLYFVSGSPLWHHFNKRSEMASLWRYAPAGHLYFVSGSPLWHHYLNWNTLSVEENQRRLNDYKKNPVSPA